MSENKLKPCPFCGGEAKLYKEGHREYPSTYRVSCIKCFAQVASVSKSNMVIDAWNRRADNGKIH